MARVANMVYDVADWPEGLTSAGASAMLEAAVDQALLAHRREVLPRHFTREAITRYPEAYAGACPGPSPKNKVGTAIKLERGALSAWLKAATPEVRRNYFAQWRVEQRERLAETTRQTRGLVSSGSRDRSRDRHNEIPLYDTGAYRAMVLGGGGQLSGPAFNRALRIEVPLPYAHVVRRNWKGAGLNKTKAVQATTEDEQQAFATNMDAVLQQQFNAIP